MTINYRTIRLANGNRATVAIENFVNNRAVVAFAVCNESRDQFNRKIGQRMAAERLSGRSKAHRFQMALNVNQVEIMGSGFVFREPVNRLREGLQTAIQTLLDRNNGELSNSVVQRRLEEMLERTAES